MAALTLSCELGGLNGQIFVLYFPCMCKKMGLESNIGARETI